MHPLKKKHRGVEQLVARQAHNLEVARSNPASEARANRFALLCSFHLGQYFPVVPVGGLDAVLNTAVP